MKGEKLEKNDTVELLMSIVKSVTGVDPSVKTSDQEVVMARKLFYKALRDTKNWSYYKMGRVFVQDHATVRHAVKDVENMFGYRSDLIEAYNKIHSMLSKALISDDYVVVSDMNGHIYQKLIELNDVVNQQNLYIAELKGEIVKMQEKVSKVSDRNKEYEPVVDLLFDRLPKAKISKAVPKIKAVLNGL